MSKKNVSLTTILVFAFASISFGNDLKNQTQVSNEVLNKIPVSLSFVPNIGTGGLDGKNNETNVSLNIIGGSNGSLKGVEFGGIINIETRDVKGLQHSGVVNTIGGNVMGWQEAGVCNIVRGNVYGNQNSGVVNTTNYIYGMQGSGVINISTMGVNGIQAAGVTNITNGTVNGMQISGVYNQGADLNGVQISGVVNMANNVHGVQIGLINISENINGLSFGLFNYVRSVGLHYQVYVDEIGAASFALRNGGEYLYTLLTAGAKYHDENNVACYLGWGIGGKLPLNEKFFTNIDAITQVVYSDSDNEDETDFLGKLRMGGGWKFHPQAALIGGFSMNLFISKENKETMLPDYVTAAEKYDDFWARCWPGAYIGLEF